MLHRLVFVVCWLAVFAGSLPAFEIEATIKKVDVGKGVVVFTAGGTDRTMRLPKDVKVLDAQGQELAYGLKATELREGAAVALTVEREDDKPVLKAITLGKKTDKPAPQEEKQIERPKDGEWESLPDGSTGRTTSFKGKEDIVIAAYVRKPMGKGPFPVVVLLHGGQPSVPATYGLGRTTGHPTADFLAAGWAIYSIDYRPFKRFFDDAEWEDTAEAIASVRRLEFIDKKRVALFGGSHGGNVICRLASRVEVCCGVPCAPAGLDLCEVAKVARGGAKVAGQLTKLVEQMEKQHGVRAEEIAKAPEKFGYRSALTEVKDVKFPLLIVSGRNDDASPIPVAEAYVNRLKATGKQVETYYPDNGPHGFYFGRPEISAETKECARLAVEFISKHFAKEPAAANTKNSADDRRAAELKKALKSAWVHADKAVPAGTKYQTFRSKTITADVSYLIYLPPDYQTAGQKRYPVVYWLHGSGGSPRGSTVFAERLDAAIRAVTAPPMIVVGVNGLKGETMYCDTKDGQLPVESVFIKDLIPHVDNTYRTIAGREGRGVEGFSMGGFGAAHIGFKYPELFSVVSILAPALLSPEVAVKQRKWNELLQLAFDGDVNYFKANDPYTLVEKKARLLRKGTAIRIIAHDEAEGWLIPRCQALHEVLKRHEVPHRFEVHDKVKVHSPRLLYDDLGDEAIGFFTKGFAGATAKE